MFLNTRRTPYRLADRALIGRSQAANVRALLGFCPAHRATPLLPLAPLAAEHGLGGIHVKAEWRRMGLSSFKPLGGAYAVALLVTRQAEAALGRAIRPDELQSPAVQAVARGLTVICASAGNHGLAVAAGAGIFGARAIVYLSAAVPESFAVRLRAQGATVERAGASYEESMALAADAAKRRGWHLISDSSWPGYTQVPLDIMRGYTVLLEEAADTLAAAGGPASHVFVQAGVGGLAAAAIAYLRDRWGEDFRFIVVEPDGAPCLLESTQCGHPVRVTGAPTSLGRLDCKEPSLLAFDLLSQLADAFMTVSDAAAEAAASRLGALGAPVSACGAAGAAGLIAACGDAEARRQLGLDGRSRVLLIGTEAADILHDPGPA
jgi:diaminopropionate ammonia-lyase